MVGDLVVSIVECTINHNAHLKVCLLWLLVKYLARQVPDGSVVDECLKDMKCVVHGLEFMSLNFTLDVCSPVKS